MPVAETLQERNFYKHSCLRIETSARDFDYNSKWLPPTLTKWHGSGFILKHNDKVCILTNAHVADYPTTIKARFADDGKKYIPKILQVDNDADLALLEITDPDFLAKASPITMGQPALIGDKVRAVGFPMMSEEMTITTGRISNIEVQDYVQGSATLLSKRTDAAVNPGNSGGMVVNKNHELVGIAFQAGSLDGQGFIIPTEVINHFLTDYFTHDIYRGFPDIGFFFQDCTNPGMKRHFGMDVRQTGIRVSKVDQTSAANDILKEDDIILEIDGYKVQDDGKVNTEDGDRLDHEYLFSKKQIGDQVRFKLLRNREETTVEVTLQNRSRTTKKVELEHQKAPSYFIHRGVCFANVTVNDETLDSLLSQNSAKKGADDQIVVIHEVFDCDHTDSYDDAKGEVVREINGQKIRNLRDAYEACQKSGEQDLTIKLAKDRNQLLVIPPMSDSELRDFKETYHIDRMCSNDLKTAPQYDHGRPEWYAFPQYRKHQQQDNTTTTAKEEQNIKKDTKKKRQLRKAATHDE